MDENAKKKALLMIPYGLYVMGVNHNGKQTVATVNWVTQTAFAPPLVVVGVKKDSSVHQLLKDSGKFTISFLESGQKKMATSFFKHVEPQNGKFADCAFESGNNGCPIMSDAPAAVECDVAGFYELGDHSTVVGRVTEGHLKRESKIMMLSETGFNYGG